jgi:hypothetical protein
MRAFFPLSFRPHAGSLRRARSVAAGAALLSACVALLSACAVDSEPLFEPVEPLDTNVSRPGNLPTFSAPGGGGRGASDGVRGEATAGLISVDAGLAAAGALSALDAGGDAGAPCQLAAECDDGNECTLEECSAGSCRSSARPAGAACGSAEQSECTQPDSCDGEGNCVANHAAAATPCGRGASAGCTADACDGAGSCQALDVAAGTPCGGDGGGCSAPVCDGTGSCEARAEPNGAACPGGSCSLGACVAGQPVGCPAVLVSTVPFESSWSSVGRPNLIQGSCDDSLQTPDFALVFSAPGTGEYRIDAQGSQDSVLVVRAGACGGNQLACNDDLSSNDRDSRIELLLSAGQTITIYVSEFGNGSSGQGSIRISLL